MLRYSDEHRAWLAENIGKATYQETAERFTERFGIPRTGAQISDYANRHGLGTMYSSRGAIRWNDEKMAYLAEIIPGRTSEEISRLFQERYGRPLTKAQISGRKVKLGIRQGIRCGQFEKGQTPFNKGKTWDDIGMPEASRERCRSTQFAKNNQPHNTRPIGSEWVGKDGIHYIKIKDKTPDCKRFGRNGAWKSRARIVWEEHHGPIGDDVIVVHANRIPGDDRIENLLAVERGTYAVMQSMFSHYHDMDSLKVCVDLAELTRMRKRKVDESKEVA